MTSRAKPPGSDKKRKMWSFRPTPEAMAFIDSTAERDRVNKTDVVCDCVLGIRDVRDALGDDWYEIERQARVENVTVGAVLGRVLKTSLERGRKK